MKSSSTFLSLCFCSWHSWGSDVNPHSRLVAEILLAISSVGLLVLLLGARTLEPIIRRLFSVLKKNPKIAAKLHKLEHWLLLALQCIRDIGIFGSLLLLVQSFIIWTCEGMIFVSAARLIGLATDRIGPWQAVSVANLSYLIPSSPGAIGTFEWAVKTSLVSHGAAEHAAALLRPRTPCVAAYLRHRSRRHPLPHPPHSNPEHNPIARRDRNSTIRTSIDYLFLDSAITSVAGKPRISCSSQREGNLPAPLT